MEKALLHTSTFGGNTWAMAAGIAALNTIVEQDLPRQAAEKGEYFITNIRASGKAQPNHRCAGRGLLIGLEFAKPGGWWTGSPEAVSKLSEEYLGAMVAGELLNR